MKIITIIMTLIISNIAIAEPQFNTKIGFRFNFPNQSEPIEVVDHSACINENKMMFLDTYTDAQYELYCSNKLIVESNSFQVCSDIESDFIQSEGYPQNATYDCNDMAYILDFFGPMLLTSPNLIGYNYINFEVHFMAEMSTYDGFQDWN